MSFHRRALLASAGALVAGREAFAQAQPAWPSRPVSVLVPFAPGGSTDFVARLIAQEFSTIFGQQFVVDNRPGASGTVAAGALARARPDGYTLAVMPNGTFAMAPSLFPLSYDNATAFTPIGLIATNAMFICVAPDAPWQNLGQLIEASRAAPGRISFGSAGAGVANHLGPELLADMANIQWLHVPYRSGAAALQDVIAKQVQISFVDSVTAIPFLRDRTLRALAYTGDTRSPQAPDVPTVAELGFPGYRASTDFGLFAPAGTPAPIVTRLSEAMRQVMGSAATKSRLEPLAIDPVGGTAEAFGPYMQAESTKWGELIRKRNIRPES
ncbi:Bug family tripartite tricarboxylate transporter substrate binding protein [Falsiroseomonas sp. HW251]|uniref:Bug family tripartite tricarboxylate transporter substrate binding protein n=1 Tax=Falsiroseomonas sp. HW251 TaxID=3390998 RepID=UPI003D32365E